MDRKNLRLLVGLKKFQILHLRREDFHGLRKTMILHLKTGFPMGFQMSVMCIGILLRRHPIVQMFLSNPSSEIYHYSDLFLTIEAPFYFLLGLLAVYRTSIQSMQNGRAPFMACMIELVMRIAATVGLARIIGFTAVCIASPMAWFGACVLLIPCYYQMMKKLPFAE